MLRIDILNMEPKLGSVPRDTRMFVLFDEIYRT
jgi:hypothetical protein